MTCSSSSLSGLGESAVLGARCVIQKGISALSSGTSCFVEPTVQSYRCVQVFHRMHMVFGTLFIIFMLMHDIKLWIYAVPGEQCRSRQVAGPHH